MQQGEFPPRGSGVAGRLESPPAQVWGHPWQLGASWDWRAGNILLGHWEGRKIGRADDRHMVTIAGTRAGKSSTVLIPNLLRYPGPSVVLDPKGEMALATAVQRQRMGQRVYVFDPFKVTGIKTANYNPFAEIATTNRAHVSADVAQVADAMIVNNASDPHWTDSGKNLIRGLTLHLMASSSVPPTMRVIRRTINSTTVELEKLFTAMAGSAAFDGIVANTGAAFLGKLETGPRELQSILSTVQEQTASFDDVAHVMETSDLKLTDLGSGGVTIYLVLPGMRMGTHYRWLRLMVQLALGAMERAPVPREKLPVWFVLEEFPTLGHMKVIETAAGLMAGYGVKLWAVLQDLTQLKTHYPRSWETFIGNAGIVQAFGNSDASTCEYLSKKLGTTRVMERQEVRVTSSAMAHGDTGLRENMRSASLLDANEITTWFARETGRQLVLVAGRPPIYMQRLSIGG